MSIDTNPLASTPSSNHPESDAAASNDVMRAIAAARNGQPVVIRYGDQAMIAVPASMVTTSLLSKFERATAAPAAVALDAGIFDSLGLKLQTDTGTGFPQGIPVDVHSDAFEAMSRGGRANSIRALANPGNSVFSTPGHVTPLRSSPGNLLTRLGLVEAAVELMALAGLPEAALVAFLIDDAGKFITDASSEEHVTLEQLRTARLLSSGGLDTTAVSGLFVDTMSRLASALSVVTCFDTSDSELSKEKSPTPVGLVVSSMVSYSSVPPSVVFSVATSTRSHAALARATHFGVNILARGQEEVARNFASRLPDKFEAVRWSVDSGTPQVAGAQAYLHCLKVKEFELGDHTLFVGSILSGTSAELEPLVYYDRKFTWELREPQEQS